MTPYTLSDAELEALLRDDSPCGDATTWGLGIGDLPGRLAKHSGNQRSILARHGAIKKPGEPGLFLSHT